MKPHSLRHLAVAFLAVISGLAVAVDRKNVSIHCNYDSYSDNTGHFKVKAKEPFTLNFLVDTETRKTYMSGQLGMEEVKSIRNDQGGWTYIGVSDAGNVATTTIVTETKSPDFGKSIHSRNTIVLGELVPSQYYGRCSS